MIVHYIDPSAWVKRHFQEAGSETVNTLFRGSIYAACSRLGIIEMLATTARKSTQDSLAPAQTQTVLDNIRGDFTAFRIVPLDESIASAAEQLSLRHRLRTMDSIHLASAVSIRPLGQIIMVSADIELLAAAAHEGIVAMNPALPRSLCTVPHRYPAGPQRTFASSITDPLAPARSQHKYANTPPLQGESPDMK